MSRQHRAGQVVSDDRCRGNARLQFRLSLRRLAGAESLLLLLLLSLLLLLQPWSFQVGL